MTQQVHGSGGAISISSKQRWVVAAAIALLTIVVRLPGWASPGFKEDMTQFVAWSEMSQTASRIHPPGGIPAVYEIRPDGSGKTWCNYPPGYVYVLHGLGRLYDWIAPPEVNLSQAVAVVAHPNTNPDAARWVFAIYKSPAVLADAMMGALLFLIISGRHSHRLAALVSICYVLVPSVIHNSTIWGQVDAIPTLLMVISLELARRRRLLWMTLAAMLAVLTKAQAAMLFPLWLMVAIRWIVKDGNTDSGCDEAQKRHDHARRTEMKWPMLRLLSIVGVLTAVLLVMLYPVRHVLPGVWQVYANAASYYPYLHLNGFSVWFLAAPLVEPHLHSIPMSAWYPSDRTGGLFSISPHHWGLIALMFVWGFVIVRLWRRRCSDEAIFRAARLLPLAFFVLSTQMHERYLYPALAIWAWSFADTRRWWISWITIGLCATINAFWVWPGPAGGFWIPDASALLHRTWAGLSPGVWCSLVLIGVFGLCLIGGMDRRSRRTHASQYRPQTQ